VHSPFAWYREFVPCEALRADVYAFFSFVPGTAVVSPARSLLREVAFRKPIVCAPQFADGHVSVRFEVGRTCDIEGRWHADSKAFGETVIGPMSGVGRTNGLDLSETVGAYFRPGGASRFFDTPLSGLADTAVAVGDIWGTRGSPLSGRLAGLSERARSTSRAWRRASSGEQDESRSRAWLALQGCHASTSRESSASGSA
jgi:hypothetical protein